MIIPVLIVSALIIVTLYIIVVWSIEKINTQEQSNIDMLSTIDFLLNSLIIIRDELRRLCRSNSFSPCHPDCECRAAVSALLLYLDKLPKLRPDLFPHHDAANHHED